MSRDESYEAAGPSEESLDLPSTAASPQLENDQSQASYIGQQQSMQDSPSDPHAAPATGSEMYPPYGAYPPAPPARRNRGLLIGIAIGAVVVAGGGIGAYAALGHSSTAASSTSAAASATGTAASAASATSAASSSTSSAGTSAANPVSLPTRVDGLLLLTSGNAQQEVSRVRSGVEKGGAAAYTNALIGAYGPQANGGYRLVLVDQSLNNLSSDSKNQFLSYTPSALVQAFATGAHMTGTQVENSSDPSAALICGTLTENGVSVPTCIWDDSNTFGLAYFFTAYYTTGLSDAAHYTDALRAAAEGE